MTTKPGKYDVLATCFMATGGGWAQHVPLALCLVVFNSPEEILNLSLIFCYVFICLIMVSSVPDTRGSVGHVSDPDRSSGWLFRQSKVSKYGVKKPPPRLRPGEFFTSILSLSDAPAKVLTAKCPSDFA